MNFESASRWAFNSAQPDTRFPFCSVSFGNKFRFFVNYRLKCSSQTHWRCLVVQKAFEYSFGCLIEPILSVFVQFVSFFASFLQFKKKLNDNGFFKLHVRYRHCKHDLTLSTLEADWKVTSCPKLTLTISKNHSIGRITWNLITLSYFV